MSMVEYIVLGCVNCPFRIRLGIGRWCIHPPPENDRFAIRHLEEDDPEWCPMEKERELHLVYRNPTCKGPEDDGSGLCGNPDCETCYCEEGQQ